VDEVAYHQSQHATHGTGQLADAVGIQDVSDAAPGEISSLQIIAQGEQIEGRIDRRLSRRKRD